MRYFGFGGTSVIGNLLDIDEEVRGKANIKETFRLTVLPRIPLSRVHKTYIVD